MFVQNHGQAETKGRLIAAASALFAERGFHGTKVRDIATRAGVNLAAGNYHYGSKKTLYVEVLRAQFAEVQDLLTRRGATRPASELRRLSRAALEDLLRTRVHAMLDLVIGPQAALHATLMQREMTDPSDALPTIVEELITPMTREMERIVTHLEPALRATQIRRCVFSIIGQVLFFRFARPAVLQLIAAREYPAGLSAELAKHMTDFSLGGLHRLAGARRAPGKGRRR
jgi:TetR/AcrR family transcriptional regulator, regulator of cefoperazone and chloramphenicol sensitivity